jgi:hypothetical protein
VAWPCGIKTATLGPTPVPYLHLIPTPPVVHIMAPAKQDVHDKFVSKVSEETRQRRLSSFTLKKKPNVQAFSSLTQMWAGIAGQTLENNTKFEIGMCSRSPISRDPCLIRSMLCSDLHPRLRVHDRLLFIRSPFLRQGLRCPVCRD